MGILQKSGFLLCIFAKGFIATKIHREMFYVYGGKCLSRKAVYKLVEIFSQKRSQVAGDARPGAEVAETTVKILLCCWVGRTVK
jgi:hypothetical protein